jgi:beta-lactamase class A
MKKLIFWLIPLVFFCVVTAAAQKIGKYETVALAVAPELQRLVDRAAVDAIAKFADKGLKEGNLAATVIDLRKPDELKAGSFRGEEKIYPASVSKMFYLVALHQWLENGKLKMSPALQKAMKDMIVDSSNEATQYIVDALTETSNGEELAGKDFEKYAFKRNVVNRYFASLNYQNIVINQKTYCEDLYGRERQFWNEGKNRNMLTTNATARLMAEIALRRAVTANRSEQMLELMKRDWEAEVKDPEDQAHGFTGIALKDLKLTGAKIWSKAGWTSTTRHDVAYIETPDGLKLVICVYTTNFAKERDILPSIAKVVLQGLGEIR